MWLYVKCVWSIYSIVLVIITTKKAEMYYNPVVDQSLSSFGSH